MADYQYQETYEANRSNGLGLAGFITSLVGIVSCGILSPIGALLSFFGLFKSPRGFALAGFLIGAVGSVWLIVAAAFIGMIIGLPIFTAIQVPEVSTGFRIGLGIMQVEQFRTEHGALPDLSEWDKIRQDAWFTMDDGWGKALDYLIDDDGNFIIRSAGSDGIFDTQDDISSVKIQNGNLPTNDIDTDHHEVHETEHHADEESESATDEHQEHAESESHESD
jgi:hypothetical protein